MVQLLMLYPPNNCSTVVRYRKQGTLRFEEASCSLWFAGAALGDSSIQTCDQVGDMLKTKGSPPRRHWSSWRRACLYCCLQSDQRPAKHCWHAL